jgi:leucyl/phenylalanyl-tRNA--protein transferase
VSIEERTRMAVFRLIREHVFPDPSLADASGLLAIGGDLHPERMLLGYRTGIFPWYSEGEPILWYSPDPRFVLPTDALHVPRSLAKRRRRGDFRFTIDSAFSDVVQRCARAPRPGQDGTWITREMRAAYDRLHKLGAAHSVEAWIDGALVGGLYGVAVGRLFCGESMFSDVDDASKLAFVALVEQLRRWDFPLIDSQVYTPHVARFGGFEIPREDYLERIEPLVEAPGWRGAWAFDADLAGGAA